MQDPLSLLLELSQPLHHQHQALLLQQVAVNMSFHTLGLIDFNKTEIYQWQNLPGADNLSLNNRIKHLFIYVKKKNVSKQMKSHSDRRQQTGLYITLGIYLEET